MRVFRQEEVVSEITEADRVTHLECIAGKRGSTRWGFGLANGEASETRVIRPVVVAVLLVK